MHNTQHSAIKKKPVLHYFPGLRQWSNLPALFSLLLFSLGIVMATFRIPFAVVTYLRLYPFVIIAAIVCSVMGIIIRKKPVRALLFFLGGYLFFTAQQVKYEVNDAIIDAGKDDIVVVSGRVVTPPAPRFGRISYILKVSTVENETLQCFIGHSFLCSSDAVPPYAGDIVVKTRMRAPGKRIHQYAFDERQYFMAKGITGYLDIEHLQLTTVHRSAGVWMRSFLRDMLKKYQNLDIRSIMRAVITGERREVAPHIKDAFTNAGVIHILALSGFHAAILLAAVYAVLFFIPVKRNAKHCAAVGILWVYLLFVGMIPSLARAVMMTTAVLIAMIFQRKLYPLQILSIAALCWLVFSPVSLFQPGFQLSYTATFGIVTLYPRLRKLMPTIRGQRIAFVVEGLWASVAVSLAAFIMTFPVVLYHFGRVSPYGIIATTVVVPLLTGALWLFFAALPLGMVLPVLANICISISSVLMNVLIGLVALVSRFPFAGIELSALPPETVIVFYGALLAMSTIDRVYIKKTVLVACGVLVLFIPADMLIHRYFGAPVLFAGRVGNGVPFVVIRWRSGVACCLSRCSVAHLSGVARSVGFWAHRFPGTGLQRWCCYSEDGIVADSSGDGAPLRSLHMNPDDTVVIENVNSSAQGMYCSFIPKQDLFIARHGHNCIQLQFKKDGIDYLPSEHEQKEVPQPFKVVFGKNFRRIHRCE